MPPPPPLPPLPPMMLKHDYYCDECIYTQQILAAKVKQAMSELVETTCCHPCLYDVLNSIVVFKIFDHLGSHERNSLSLTSYPLKMIVVYYRRYRHHMSFSKNAPLEIVKIACRQYSRFHLKASAVERYKYHLSGAVKDLRLVNSARLKIPLHEVGFRMLERLYLIDRTIGWANVLNLNLKHLCLNVPRHELFTVEQLLKHYARTLVTFTWHTTPSLHTMILEISVAMPNLTDFEITEGGFVISALTILRKLPALRTTNCIISHCFSQLEEILYTCWSTHGYRLATLHTFTGVRLVICEIFRYMYVSPEVYREKGIALLDYIILKMNITAFDEDYSILYETCIGDWHIYYYLLYEMKVPLSEHQLASLVSMHLENYESQEFELSDTIKIVKELIEKRGCKLPVLNQIVSYSYDLIPVYNYLIEKGASANDWLAMELANIAQAASLSYLLIAGAANDEDE
jgi:hypothetical protein